MKALFRIVALALAAVLILSSTGCWLFINRDKYEAEALALFQTGESFYKKNDYTNAIASYDILIKKYPYSQLLDDAYYMISLSFAKNKDWEHAVGAVQKLFTIAPSSPLVHKTFIIKAEGYENMGMYPEAIASYFDTYLYSKNHAEVSIAETKAKNLLGREEDYHALQNLYATYKRTNVAEWLLYQLGSRAFDLKEYEASERYFAELRRRFPHSRYIDKIEGREITAATLKGELVCGVLLPLSGSFSTYGQNVKRGVELAHSFKSASPIKLIYYDTQSNPAQAAQGIQELIVKGAKVVIGPLTSKEVEASVKIAAINGVIMISPTSTDPNLLSLYEGLFQLNSYPEEETRQIAKYALKKGVKKFGILYPQNKQGRFLADVFSATVKARGAQLLYSIALSDTVVNMKETFLTIRHQGAEAVFVPFDEHQLLSVVPQIGYYKMKTFILGLDDFADEEILRKGGVTFEGIWFASPPGRITSPHFFETFYSHYQRKYTQSPDWASALGYDAYNFLYDALTEGKNRGLDESLRNIKNRKGVMGRLVYLSSPSAPAIRIYTIYKNEVKEIK